MTTAPPDSTAEPTGAPLSGRSVIVTRTLAQAHTLVEPLEALGAEVLAFPVLETVDPDDWGPLDAAIANLASYDWVVLTSTNGVDRFLKRFRAVKGSRDAILDTKFAAVGSATAAKLAKHGLPPALVPADFRAEGLVEAFREMGAEAGCRVLIPRAEEAREVLPDELRAMGCDVDVVCVYRTRPAAADPAVVERLRAGTVDVVTFTSGAIARGFVSAVEAAGLDAEQVIAQLTVASIGPVTSDAIREMGFTVDVEAAESTMGSLVDAIERAVLGRSLAPDDQEGRPQHEAGLRSFGEASGLRLRLLDLERHHDRCDAEDDAQDAEDPRQCSCGRHQVEGDDQTEDHAEEAEDASAPAGALERMHDGDDAVDHAADTQDQRIGCEECGRADEG